MLRESTKERPGPRASALQRPKAYSRTGRSTPRLCTLQPRSSMTRLKIKTPPSWRSPWTVPAITLCTGCVFGLPGRRDQRDKLLSQKDCDQTFLEHGIALTKPAFARFDRVRDESPGSRVRAGRNWLVKLAYSRSASSHSPAINRQTRLVRPASSTAPLEGNAGSSGSRFSAVNCEINSPIGCRPERFSSDKRQSNCT